MKLNVTTNLNSPDTLEEEYDINNIIKLSEWEGHDDSDIDSEHNIDDDINVNIKNKDRNKNKDKDTYKNGLLETPDNFFIIDNFIQYPDIRRSSWVRDDVVVSCEICSLEFSIFRRKHHCRCCGKIFCYECTKYSIIVPDLDQLTTPTLTPKKTGKERVCSFCYKKILDFQYLENMYIILSHLPLEIGELNKLSYVSRTWNRVSKYYRANYRKILHKKFCENFTKLEKNFIWVNRRILAGHNNWLVQVIRIIEEHYSHLNYDTNLQAEIQEILYSSKNTSCRTLRCFKRCHQQLGTEDAILCLSLPYKKLVSEPYLMDIICTGPIKELLCYLPILVDILKYRDDNNALSDYLFKISKCNYEFANHLFWEITVQMENKVYDALYERLRLRLTESLEDTSKEHLKNSFYFVENLTEMVSTEDKFPTLLQAYFNTLHDTGIYSISSPVNHCVMLTNVNQEGIRIRGSSSKPISIPFYTRYNEVDTTLTANYELLYKKDDVRKDLIIMNIIKLIDIILKRDEGLDLYIITYNIVPTSSKTGFIEIVRDAETILGINKRKKFSILNFILEHNPDKSVDQIRARFTKSCVAYCILSYLLGIGDRHMENIMVKTSGEIFHIDFGFILGADPKPLAPEIRITDEMVDAMGGYESKHYAQFKELCARSFLCLRRHVGIFRCMFSSFTMANPPIDKKLTKEYIDKFITNKFLVGENVSNAKLYLINKVSTRSRGYSESLIDFCHQAQDSTSVINSSLTNSAMNLGSSIIGMFWK